MGGFIDNEVVGAPRHVPPYSHAAGFTACSRTDLVACADVRSDVMERFGERYNIPKERQYTDYREMIARENLDIVSVATQPEPRAEIVIYAAEQGVKAIYAEKAMAASLAEADAMVEALERNNVLFNLGTNRRWSPSYDAIKAFIDDGNLGELKNLIVYNTGTLFNMGSHIIDLVMRLNSDVPAVWVQAYLSSADNILDGDILMEDPVGTGTIYFENGVTASLLVTPRGLELEAIGTEGVLSAFNDAQEWLLRRPQPIDPQGRKALLPAEGFEPPPLASSTLLLVEDLVHALDTGEPSRSGPRVALASMELIFAFIESHLQGGARVYLPLRHRTVRLQRNHTPLTPKYEV
jgi:predicted dehydrogenase